MTRLDARTAIFLAALASAAMLAAAHGFERFLGLDPCSLCLRQREVYWAALGVAGAALAAGAVGRPVDRLGAGALGLVFLVGAGIALYHAGAEYKWWPGPLACSGLAPADAAPVTGDSIMKSLTTPQRVVRCDVVAWSFAGVSMAGYNVLISLALACAMLTAALAAPPRKDLRHA